LPLPPPGLRNARNTKALSACAAFSHIFIEKEDKYVKMITNTE